MDTIKEKIFVNFIHITDVKKAAQFQNSTT